MPDQQALRRLLKLQDVDSRRTEVQQRLAELVEDAEGRRLRERVTELQERLEATEQALTKTNLRMRRCELDIESFESEQEKIQQRIYSGHAGARELDQLDEKIETLAARQDERETELLEAMEASEELEQQLDRLRDELTQARQTLEEHLNDVAEETERQERELADLDERRAERRKPVDDQLLREYDYRRQRIGDPAAVPLNDRTCGGCGLPLPPAMAKRVTRADEIQSCENCGRILCPV